MRAKTTPFTTFITFLAALCTAGAGAAGKDEVRRVDLPERSAPAAKLEIAAKTVPAHTAVYIEHTGPYWRLGPLFRQVDQHRRHFGRNAPIYARFCAPPLDPQAASCPTEVGLIVEKARASGDIFETVQREPELVAFCVIPSRVSSMRRHYRPMLDWIRENDYVPVGPVSEVHLPRPEERPVASPRTEIRIVIRPQESSAETANAQTEQPQQPKDDAPRPSTSEDARHAHSLAQPPPAPASDDAAARSDPRETADRASNHAVQTQPATSPPTDSSPKLPAAAEKKPKAGEKPALSAKSPDDSNRQIATGQANATEPRPDQSAQPPEPPRPIAELVRHQQWDRIALRLMPEGIRVPPPDQLWFGQAVFRIGAVGKGISQQFPQQQPDVVALATAIGDRYSRISAHFSTDPLSQPVVRIDPNSDFAGAAKRKILRDLDTLLGQVAFRRSDPADALEKLTGIVERMIEAMPEETP